jgi:hypothetical protein
MASNPVQSSSRFVDYVEAHPLIVAGGVIAVGLLISFLRNKNQSQASTTPAASTALNSGINPLTGAPYANPLNSYVSGSNVGALINSPGSYNNGINPLTGLPYTDNSGLINPLTGQQIAYVPTGTSFTTNNVGAELNGQQGAVTVNATNSITSSSPTTVTNSQSRTRQRHVAPAPPIAPATPVVNNPAPTPPAAIVSPPAPAPPASPTPVSAAPVTPPAQYAIVWNYPYTVKGGDTLSGIAANITSAAHTAGMPSSQSITWQDIYNHNTNVINSTATAHGNPIPGGPWNNIFPGEQLQLATWSKVS